MLAQSTSVLDTIQEAFLPEGPHKPHHLTVSLEGAQGTTNLRTRLQGGCTAVPTWEATHRPDRQKRGCVRRRGEGGKTHALPSILSEKVVFKITKCLSNPFLFFSHFLKVFQEFWSKRSRKISRKLS